MQNETFHFVHPNAEEQQQWDLLVEQSDASVFSKSGYLNALIGDWTILYNQTRTGGMVCPFTVKFGQKILINPIYHQYSEWVGEGELTENGIEFLKTEFPVSQLCFRSEVSFLNAQNIKWKHQLIDSNNFSINVLAKRMLKKSEEYEIRLNDEISLIYDRIEKDLVGRVQGMNSENVKSLKNLVDNFAGNGFHSICAYRNEEFVGGIWLLENSNAIMYLKGSVIDSAKKDGVMYRLLFTAINETLSKNKTFWFGGSNVENVRRFNLNLGGTDVGYTQFLWNSAPWWWNLLRTIRQKLR